MYLNEEDIQQIALFEENEIHSLLNNEVATKKEIERLLIKKENLVLLSILLQTVLCIFS